MDCSLSTRRMSFKYWLKELKKGRLEDRYLAMRPAESMSMCVDNTWALCPLLMPNGKIFLTRKSFLSSRNRNSSALALKYFLMKQILVHLKYHIHNTVILRTHIYDAIYLNVNIENKYLSLRLSSGFSSSSETLSSSEEESSGCRFFFGTFCSRIFLAFGALPKNDKARF